MVSERKVYNKAYYLAHMEQMKARNKSYNLAHPEYMREYRSTHPDRQKINIEKWHLAHPENLKKQQKKYRQTLKGKGTRLKHNAVRRQLGFIPLNEYFKGSEGHHVDRERVIYIPLELHQSIWHSITQNKNMDAINKVAFNFLILKHTKSTPKAIGAMSVGQESSSSVGGVLYCA